MYVIRPNASDLIFSLILSFGGTNAFKKQLNQKKLLVCLMTPFGASIVVININYSAKID